MFLGFCRTTQLTKYVKHTILSASRRYLNNSEYVAMQLFSLKILR